MDIDADTTKGTIRGLAPARRSVSERRGVDADDDRRLGEAAAEAGIETDRLILELEAVATESATGTAATDTDSVTLNLTDFVDQLEATHHAYLRDAFVRLPTLGAHVIATHGADHPELADVLALLATLCDELEPHLRKEELALFPMVRQLDAATGPRAEFHCGSLASPIGVMRHEHEQAGALLQDLRAATEDFTAPAAASASWIAWYAGLAELESDTLLHVYKENVVLFPAVLAAEIAPG